MMEFPVRRFVAVIFLLLCAVAVCFWIKSHTRAVTIQFPPASGLPTEGSLVHQADNRETLLALPYKEFDQTQGSGWRPLVDERHQYREAAELIVEYLQRHPEVKGSQRAVLHFHAGDVYF
jgi:hypothetical protein